MLNKWTKNTEAIMSVLIVLIVALCLIISPQYRTVNNLFNMLRSTLITGILAISCLLVTIIGGLDLSFMAIASFSMYSVVKVFTTLWPEAPVLLMFLLGLAVGVALGLVNAFFVIITKMPIFIVTLGTQFIFSGACLAFVGTSYLQVPVAMVNLSKANFLTATDASGAQIGLNVSMLFLVVLYVGAWLMLNYTKFGRSLYAIGGDTVGAQRVGINVPRHIVAVFAIAGGIAAIAGVLNGALLRLAVPGDLVGGELTVIAAVILGGANAAKGKGTIHGTLLGVILITVISNSLNLLKIPTFWQEAVLGAVIILGTVFSSLSGKKSSKVKALAA